MSEELDNSNKGSWQGESFGYLLRRLKQEVRELDRAVKELEKNEYVDDDRYSKRVASEAADVENFAMMIADNAGGLEP